MITQPHAPSTDTTMTAAVYRTFGGPEVVTLERVARPTRGPGEVLIRVRTTTVSAADHRTRSKDVPNGMSLLASPTIGFRAPRISILGMDCAGVVEAVGDGVTHVAPGDEVIALLGARFGGHAEYAISAGPQTIVVPKPANLSFEEAVAIVFGGWTAQAFLDTVDLAAGKSVLVNGASGAVGTAFVQLAALAGAHVTGVCSGANAELVRSLGAERVIDYTTTDPTADGATYDVVVDCVGNIPFRRLEPLVKQGGALLAVICTLADVALAPLRRLRTRKQIQASSAPFTRSSLERVAQLAAEGRFRPVIDRTYDVAEIVEAHRYVDTGRKRGSVVVRIAAS